MNSYMLLLCFLSSIDLDICIVSEKKYFNNDITTNQRQQIMLPESKFLNKTFRNGNFSRLNIMINNKLEIEHVESLENNVNTPSSHQSTITAMASIDLNHKRLKEQKSSEGIITTDLSSTYNIVHHKLLIEKLEFYGIRTML